MLHKKGLVIHDNSLSSFGKFTNVLLQIINCNSYDINELKDLQNHY